MSKLSIGIVDYKLGNHASISQTLKKVGFRVKITSNKKDLDNSDLIILPGVSAFSLAMRYLHELDFVDYLRNKSINGVPIIGICAGMQLLASSSCEFENTPGLDLIPGKIVPFKDKSSHIGWNTVLMNNGSNNETNSYCYFNHSFYFLGSSDFSLASTSYKNQRFPSIIRKENLIGMQFHPEKSQDFGIMLLQKLVVDLCRA